MGNLNRIDPHAMQEPNMIERCTLPADHPLRAARREAANVWQTDFPKPEIGRVVLLHTTEYSSPQVDDNRQVS